MTPRSLVGMTMGARKRAAWDLASTNHRHRDHSDYAQLFSAEVDAEQALQWAENLKTARTAYRIGQRLRPCPGCAKCGAQVRRFAPTAGWKSPRKWVLWDGSQLWMIARTWKRKCAIPNLSDYLAAVEDGTWNELFCDGSGVLPARAKKVRR